MSKPWHPYVFDEKNRAFVGDFESMYNAEQELGFDSWHQSDPRRLDTRVASMLLEEITYSRAVDLGCGKGSFTAQLKRRDNQVIGVDSSKTAIRLAASYFPDIEWVCSPVDEYLGSAPPVDLIVARELLSYLQGWRDVVTSCALLTRYFLVSLYLPPDPIGYVKSHSDLEDELARHFEIVEAIVLKRRSLAVHLCESLTR
ncbi:MAG TPA: methyltransferase domain-containing protein [Thermoleophilaceae bacterium]